MTDTDATEPEQFQRLADTIDPAAGVEPRASTGLDLPLWTQNGSYGAGVDRNLIGAVLSPGVQATTHLAVTQRGAGANLSVDVAAGSVVVAGSDTAGQGNYLCVSRAVNNLIINGPPPAGQTRIDRIVARVYDTAIIGGSTNGWAIEVVQGTPAVSPVPPAVPASAYSLAQVSVPAGLAAVLNANIIDERLPWITNGAIWQTYTPQWTTFGAGAVQPVLGNGGTAGRYAMIGPKLCYVDLALGAGSTTNAGRMEFRLSLPFAAPAAARNVLTGYMTLATGAYSIFGIVTGNNLVSPYAPLTDAVSTTNRVGVVRNADSGGAVGTGIPLISGALTFTANSVIHLSGIYEVA